LNDSLAHVGKMADDWRRHGAIDALIQDADGNDRPTFIAARELGQSYAADLARPDAPPDLLLAMVLGIVATKNSVAIAGVCRALQAAMVSKAK
jgi:hypothetical protein